VAGVGVVVVVGVGCEGQPLPHHAHPYSTPPARNAFHVSLGSGTRVHLHRPPPLGGAEKAGRRCVAASRSSRRVEVEPCGGRGSVPAGVVSGLLGDVRELSFQARGARHYHDLDLQLPAMPAE
jgi:hypothetical protein